MLTSSNADLETQRLQKNGFSNCKNAMERKKGFQKHVSSDWHMEAVARYVTAPATVIGYIGDFLSERHVLKGKNKCRSKSSNTKECPTENTLKHPARQWAVL